MRLLTKLVNFGRLQRTCSLGVPCPKPDCQGRGGDSEEGSTPYGLAALFPASLVQCALALRRRLFAAPTSVRVRPSPGTQTARIVGIFVGI
jgi:hypothetical protein